MAVSKVVFGNQTVMDITDSTVDAGSLLAGKKAYGANGVAVNGSLVVSDRIRWNEAKTSVKKNLIPNKAATQTINGITFTVNSDGSVLVNGTNTAGDWATTFEISTTLLEAGEYYVSQSYSSEGAVIFLRLRVNNASGTSIKELGNKSQDSFTLSNDTNVYCDIQIRPNGVVDNVVIKPMIRLASIADDTYVPYIPDNVELKALADTKATKSGDTFTGRVSFKAADNNVQINLRPENASYYSTIQHQTGGKEATVFATKNADTSYIFVNGEDAIGNNGNGTRWQSLTPGLQIKNNKVAIGKLVASGVVPTYTLEVDGTVNASGAITQNGTPVALDYHLDQTATTSTTDPTTYTFTDARITANSVIDVYADIFGVSPSSVVASAGTCTVTFPKQDSAQSMTCRIYIK